MTPPEGMDNGGKGIIWSVDHERRPRLTLHFPLLYCARARARRCSWVRMGKEKNVLDMQIARRASRRM